MFQADIDMPQSLLDGDAARLDRAACVGSGRVASAARTRKREFSTIRSDGPVSLALNAMV